jgi:hypothetical protein
MKSSKPGKTISASVEGITPFGLWLLVGEKEYFLSFQEFPYFREQAIKAVQNVRVLHGIHLHWPDLDVDLEIDNLEHPERYPLKARSSLFVADSSPKTSSRR